MRRGETPQQVIPGDGDWHPSNGFAIKLLFAVRISSVIWNLIQRNEEVKNYWEPLHMLVYGDGFLSPEYYPENATRSYLYIFIHYIPAAFFAHFVGYSKIGVFLVIRLMIATICLGGEYYAYLSICKKVNLATGRMFLAITAFSTGMFQASTTFSPCAFSMTCSLYFLGAFLQENWNVSIICVVLSTFVGIPITAIFIVPLVLLMCINKNRASQFFKTLLLSVGVVLALQVAVDRYYYGDYVAASYNFGAQIGSPARSYETLYYYARSLLTNWNIMVLMVPFGIRNCYQYRKENDRLFESRRKFDSCFDLLMNDKWFCTISWLIFIVCSWFALMAPLSTYSEDNMFPIYPFLAFFAALNIGTQYDLFSSYYHVIMFMLFSFCRLYMLSYNYSGHMEIYTSLHQELQANQRFDQINGSLRLCFGKEWHHFPSSFFIPQDDYDGNMLPYELEIRFLDIDYGVTAEELAKKLDTQTRIGKKTNSNDAEVYVSPDSCDYIIDVDPFHENEMNFRKMPEKWEVIESFPTLNTEFPAPWYLSFYIPNFSPKLIKRLNCTLYRKIVN